MNSTREQQVVDLLKAIETGAPEPVAVIDPNHYTQHNLGVADGLAGFGALLQSLPEGSARVNTARVFEDGDFVFAHTEYDFFGPKIGFDIFRFADGRIVEHWDNLQETSGQTIFNGPVEATDLDATETNKALVRAFVDASGKYDRIHTILGKGNFVLAVSEGTLDGKHSSFYDLFRVENGAIAEQWNTIETIPPRDEWKNSNGKFGF
ncbi:MAG TPA: nuclear transport factor 2 family protein [Thermoanaerobaculia bacterium]|jgi:predicted SnoaL-like aldol condensation-catalyzing enzyme